MKNILPYLFRYSILLFVLSWEGVARYFLSARVGWHSLPLINSIGIHTLPCSFFPNRRNNKNGIQNCLYSSKQFSFSIKKKKDKDV